MADVYFVDKYNSGYDLHLTSSVHADEEFGVLEKKVIIYNSKLPVAKQGRTIECILYYGYELCPIYACCALIACFFIKCTFKNICMGSNEFIVLFI